jgi:tellurite resistance-related uncharacterized protein
MTSLRSPTPYRSSPVFDEYSLPAALQREHRTKEGVWGVIRILEGQLKLRRLPSGEEQMLTPQCPGLILPDEPHFVEVCGPVSVQVDFYNEQPDSTSMA